MSQPWPMVRLGNCCSVVSGATPKTEKEEYWGGSIKWVTPKDISKLDQPYLFDTPDKISEAGLSSCSTTLLPKGAVLLTSRAPIGNVAICGDIMCTNQGFKSLIPGPDVDSLYLYFCLLHNSKRLADLGNGATFKEVSKKIVEDFEIPLPPIEEQKRIAAILDKADSLRRKRQQALQLADDFLRATYLDIVNSLKDFGHKPISLGDIFNFRTGKLDSNAAEKDGIYPFFTCSQQTFLINTYAFDCEALLLAGNNANGDYSVKHYSGKFNAYQRTYVITLKDASNSYGFFRFALEDKLKELKRVSKGTNTKYLTMAILNEQKMFVPAASEQYRFEAIYIKVMALIDKLSNTDSDIGLLQLSLAENLIQAG